MVHASYESGRATKGVGHNELEGQSLQWIGVQFLAGDRKANWMSFDGRERYCQTLIQAKLLCLIHDPAPERADLA
ncbi:hypothetical protein CO731_00369 [Aminobacter sp. MSH1]|nr:hypothetical protein CO731_00369 [Aminobacter sp. MSH1]